MCSAIIRIKNDLKEIYADPCDEFIVKIERSIDHPLTVEIMMVGPKGSPCEHDAYTVKMQFPDDYPFSPPTMVIETETNSDVIRLIEKLIQYSLQNYWTPTRTIKSILNLMLGLLLLYGYKKGALACAMKHLSTAQVDD